jgi:hypothetical protein
VAVTLAHVGVLRCFWTCSHSEDSGGIHEAPLASGMLLMVTIEDSGGIHTASSEMLLQADAFLWSGRSIDGNSWNDG